MNRRIKKGIGGPKSVKKGIEVSLKDRQNVNRRVKQNSRLK